MCMMLIEYLFTTSGVGVSGVDEIISENQLLNNAK